MFLDGELQLAQRSCPVGVFLVKNPGAKFSNPIFQATRRHGEWRDNFDYGRLG
jgi:hypothetical protein